MHDEHSSLSRSLLNRGAANDGRCNIYLQASRGVGLAWRRLIKKVVLECGREITSTRGLEGGGPLPYELCPGVLRRSHNTEVPVPTTITATIVNITIRIPHTKELMCMIFVYNLSEIREEGINLILLST